AAFTIPMITILAQGRAKARMPRSLILCPTRELAAQVAENFETYGKYHKLSMALLIGGVSFKEQDKLIDRGVDVLIATPGRLLDHFERGKLMLTGVQVMVVDEADRMLDMGFIPDIERIFGLTPFTRQTLFFSATMPPEIQRLTDAFLHNPVRVEVARQASAAETIEQGVIRHRPSAKDKAEGEKREILRRVIKGEGESLTNAIVFCNRKRDVDVVWKSLKKHDVNVGGLHGDLDQSVRTRTLDGFRAGEIDILVASDVAARGLDIPAVSHVINYDVPIHSEDYVHRIGRTGRAGRKGKAITICFPHEDKHLAKIEELLEKEIPRLDDPMGAEAPAEEAARESDESPQPKRRARGGGRRRKPETEATDKPETEASEEKAEAAQGEAEPTAEAEEAKPEAPAKADEEKAESKPRGRARKGGRKRAKADETEPGDPRDAAGSEDPRDAGPAEDPEAGRRGRGGAGKRRGGGGGPVVGMGDHVPAFMLREVDISRVVDRSRGADEVTRGAGSESEAA
ncbi:MAG: DEAD/DEAH box helicase, partial [Pseudomonadota bacterium]